MRTVMCFVCCALAGSTIAQVPNTEKIDVNQMSLSGNVQMIKEVTYSAIECDGEIKKGRILRTNSINYNPSGNIINECMYDGGGSITSKVEYHYNKNGDKTIKKDFDDGVQNGHSVYSYNYQERKTTIQTFCACGTPDKTYTYIYNDRANIVEEICSVYDGSPIYHYINEYDNQGFKCSRTFYNSTGKITRQHTYQNDENGNISEICSYDRNGDLLGKNAYIYSFDKHGNWIQCIKYDSYDVERPFEIITREISYYSNTRR